MASFHLLLLAGLIGASDTPLAYSQAVQTSLAQAAVDWLHSTSDKSKGVAALDVSIGVDGQVRGIRLPPTGSNAATRRAALALLASAEPFAAPAAALLGRSNEAECVMRLAFAAGKRVDTTVACLPADKSLAEAAGVTGGDDAAASLFTGWHLELSGDLAGATPPYRHAHAAAPEWDLAARSLGLALVQQKHVPDAVAYLKVYVRGRSGPADAADYDHKIAGFEQQQAARLAEAKRPRQRLSSQDIVLGVRKGYALLEPCLKRARESRALAVGMDTLLLSWGVKKDGSVHATHLDGPKTLVLTEHSECLEAAMQSWRFPPYTEGSEISVKSVPIKVRGTPAVVAAATAEGGAAADTGGGAGGDDAPPLTEEPTFSTCERTAADIGAYIRSHLSKVNTCVVGERQRSPKTSIPESLPVEFVVDTDGSVRDVHITHRYYREGPMADCISAALNGSMPPAGGADCPAQFALSAGKE